MRRIAAALAMILLAAPAAAQDLKACMEARGVAAIAACGGAIDSGKLAGADLARALQFRGVALRNKGENDRALADLDESLRLNPKTASAWTDRSAVWMNKGEHDRALADAEESIRLYPKYAFGFRQRGMVWRMKGELDRAIADLDEAVRLLPSSALNRLTRGITWDKKENIERALADYDEAIRLDPKNLNAMNYRALLHERAGNLDKALADFRSVAAANPQSPGVAERIGRIEQKLAARTDTPKPESRVALILGNASYAHVPRLPNPKGDAEKIAETLKAIGFASVTLQLDLTRDKLMDALKAFSREAARADWAVVYFAGHGIEFGGNNYLIPIDATLESDRDITFEAVALDQVLLTVEGARKLRLVILDACRDNPFAKTMSRSVGTRSVGRGLAQIEPEGATLVAYAAKHGQYAMDGQPGSNSPFVTALVKNLETPGVEISLLFRKIRDDVLGMTGRRQEPFTYGSLPSEQLFFRKP